MIDPKTVGILSFDLGSPYGWAYSNYINNQKFIIKDGGSVDLNVSIKGDPITSSGISERRKRLYLFEKQLIHLLTTYKIDAVASEDVFLEHSFVQAYESLLLYLETLERIVFQVRKEKVYKFAPKTIKLIVAGNGAAKKEELYEALLNNPDVEFKKINMQKCMTSHLSDAIGIGYTFAKSLSAML